MAQDILIDSPFLGRREFVRTDGTPFWEFLEKHDITYKKSHFPFLSSSRVPRVRNVFDFEEYLSLRSRGEALAYLYDGLGKALNYVGPVLDMELKHGFNDHTDRHTLWVSQNGVELLQRAGVSYAGEESFGATSEVLMTLVGMMHDLGNFMDRKNHSTYSAWLLDRLFAHKEFDSKAWDHVMFAVLFHEEPVLLDMGINLQTGMPLQWSLVAADKMHVGRERIGGRSFESGIEKGAFEDDIHILLNAMLVRSAWYLEIDTFVWHLDFSVDQLDEKFERFTRGNKRLWVTRVMQNLFERKGKVYRDTFAKQWVKTYEPRMKMLAQSVYLLFPFVDRVVVRLTDTDTRGKVGSGMLTVWTSERKKKRTKQGDGRTVNGHGVLERWWARG
jgi:hypothetical protein